MSFSDFFPQGIRGAVVNCFATLSDAFKDPIDSALEQYFSGISEYNIPGLRDKIRDLQIELKCSTQNIEFAIRAFSEYGGPQDGELPKPSRNDITQRVIGIADYLQMYASDEVVQSETDAPITEGWRYKEDLAYLAVRIPMESKTGLSVDQLRKKLPKDVLKEGYGVVRVYNPSIIYVIVQTAKRCDGWIRSSRVIQALHDDLPNIEEKGLVNISALKSVIGDTTGVGRSVETLTDYLANCERVK